MRSNNIMFDVMLDGRFVCMMRLTLPDEIIDGYTDDRPMVDMKKLEMFIKDKVEYKRPSLKNKNYNILFV